jgi:hypothetical protein
MAALSFTGTQTGMTNHQKITVVYLISQLEKNIESYHHGSCIGADAEFHEILEKAGYWDLIEIHPCDLKSKQAKCKAPIVHKVKPPLDRNKDIVNASDILIATPKEFNEVLRSGTWATIRYAKKLGKVVFLVLPNGKYTKLVSPQGEL